MNPGKFIFSKSFLNIFALITLINLVISMSLMYFSYSLARDSIIEEVEGKQEEATTLIGIQVKNMNDIVENFCVVQFLSNDIRQLMYEDEIDNFYTIRNINRLDKATKANIFVDSVVVYNGSLEKYYRADNVYDRLEDVEALIEARNLPYLQPIISYNEFGNLRVTYAMYETDEKGRIDAAQLVNVDLNWLDNILVELAPENSNLFILNGDSADVLLGTPHTNHDYSNEISILLEDEDLSNIALDAVDINGSKYYVNISRIPETSWVLINEQAYDLVFSKLEYYTSRTIFVGLFVIGISIIMSLIISYRIYLPFRRLSQQMEEKMFKPRVIRDDVKYLENALSVRSNKIVQLEAYKTDTSEILDRNILHLLLTDYEKVKTMMEEDVINISDRAFYQSGLWHLMALCIDNFSSRTMTEEQIKTSKDSVAHYLENDLSDQCDVKWLYLGGGEFLVLVKEDHRINAGSLIGSFERHKEAINGQLKEADVSLFVDRPVAEISQIVQSYNNIKAMYEHQIFYGRKCTVTYDDMDQKNQKELSYPEIEAIRIALESGTLDEVMSSYDAWKTSLLLTDFDYYIFHVLRLLINVNHVIKESKVSEATLSLNIQTAIRSILSFESTAEIEEALKQLLTKIYNSRNQKTISRSSDMLTDSVKDYIDTNYAESGLCLKMLAQEFNLVQTHLSKQFIANYDISVAKYIHKVRMDKFVEKLAESDLHAKQIMHDVGYENESNFYKIFKKEFGVTPNEYRNLLGK